MADIRTRHGHDVPGVTPVDAPSAPAVARCGGPVLCKVCARDAARISAAQATFAAATCVHEDGSEHPLKPDADGMVTLRESCDHDHEWVEVTTVNDTERTYLCVTDTAHTRTEPYPPAD